MTAGTPDTTSAPTAPVCYRHPGRETYIRCVRCDRPICPDCMTPASVGFQCPECVARGAREVRSARTVFGGDTAGTRGTVTKALIGVNIGFFVLTALVAVGTGAVPPLAIGQFLAFGGSSPATTLFSVVPVFTVGGQSFGGVAGGEFYRLLTAGFLHYGLVHIAFNMYALWILGRECERLLGRWRFLGLYVVAGLGGAVAAYLVSDANSAVAGASGSIFGLFGALFFFFRKLRADVRGLVGILVINFAIGFLIPGISISGHVGGLITGGLLGLLLAYAPNGPSRSTVQLVGLGAVVLVLGVLVALRTVSYGVL